MVIYVVNKKNNSTNLEKNKKDKDTKLSEKKVLFQNKFLNEIIPYIVIVIAVIIITIVGIVLSDTLV